MVLAVVEGAYELEEQPVRVHGLCPGEVPGGSLSTSPSSLESTGTQPASTSPPYFSEDKRLAQPHSARQ